MIQSTDQNNKKHLLISNDFPPIPGGISNYLFSLWSRQDPTKLIVLCKGAKGEKYVNHDFGFPVYRLPLPGKFFFFLKPILFLFATLFLSFKYKIEKIHCGTLTSTCLVGLFMKKVFSIPYVLYVYGSELLAYGHHSFPSFIIKRALVHCHQLVTISNFTAKQFLDYGLSEEKLIMITPGVDTEVFRKVSLEQTPKTLRDRVTERKVIITVSRIEEYKGHKIVIRALEKLMDEFPNLLYVIVGTGPDLRDLENFVTHSLLKDHVWFAGFVSDDDIVSYYSVSDLFIMLSHSLHQRKVEEGFGIVFLEASSCNIPVIGSNTGGIPEAIEDGRTGFIVDPHDENQVVNALRKLLEDPNLAREMGQNGRKRSEEKFQWDQIAEKFSQYL